MWFTKRNFILFGLFFLFVLNQGHNAYGKRRRSTTPKKHAYKKYKNSYLSYSQYKKLSPRRRYKYIKRLRYLAYKLENNLKNKKKHTAFYQDLNFISYAYAKSTLSKKLSCIVGGVGLQKNKDGTCPTRGRTKGCENSGLRDPFRCGIIFGSVCVDRSDIANISKNCFDKSKKEKKIPKNKASFNKFKGELDNIDNILCDGESRSTDSPCGYFKEGLSIANSQFGPQPAKNTSSQKRSLGRTTPPKRTPIRSIKLPKNKKGRLLTNQKISEPEASEPSNYDPPDLTDYYKGQCGNKKVIAFSNKGCEPLSHNLSSRGLGTKVLGINNCKTSPNNERFLTLSDKENGVVRKFYRKNGQLCQSLSIENLKLRPFKKEMENLKRPSQNLSYKNMADQLNSRLNKLVDLEKSFCSSGNNCKAHQAAVKCKNIKTILNKCDLSVIEEWPKKISDIKYEYSDYSSIDYSSGENLKALCEQYKIKYKNAFPDMDRGEYDCNSIDKKNRSNITKHKAYTRVFNRFVTNIQRARTSMIDRNSWEKLIPNKRFLNLMNDLNPAAGKKCSNSLKKHRASIEQCKKSIANLFNPGSSDANLNGATSKEICGSEEINNHLSNNTSSARFDTLVDSSGKTIGNISIEKETINIAVQDGPDLKLSIDQNNNSKIQSLSSSGAVLGEFIYNPKDCDLKERYTFKGNLAKTHTLICSKGQTNDHVLPLNGHRYDYVGIDSDESGEITCPGGAINYQRIQGPPSKPPHKIPAILKTNE